MEWGIYLIFLLVGYFLRLLCEPIKMKKAGYEPVFSLPKIEDKKEKTISKLEKEKQEQLDRETKIMLDNIDNYDGTSNGQKEVK